jgi:hypothetical protein
VSLSSLLLIAVAPIVYWGLGLPWLIGNRRIALAPLLGCALAGLYAEWAMIAGLSVPIVSAGALVASLGVSVYRARHSEGLKTDFLEWLPFYFVSVLIAALSPFPVLGHWGGDWLITYQMGEAVMSGSLPASMLTRPPLFGASTAPLWLFQRGLIPYQVMAAVASAATVTATLRVVRFLSPSARALLMLPLVLSPFFLHNTAAAWSKLLAGAFVLIAIVEALQSKRVASALLFALAVAVHEGYIIWAPCVLLCHAVGPGRWRAVARAAGAMAVAGLIIVGPLLLWVLVKYGLAAKIAASPSVTDRAASTVPFATKSVLAVLTAFVGWGPIEVIARWLGQPHPASSAVVAKEGYWLITNWITTLSGTLLGFLFPFLVAHRALRSAPRPATWPPLGAAWAIVGVSVAVLMNGILPGFYSSEGTAQNALAPLQLGIYAGAVSLLASNQRLEALRRVCAITALAGTLPWLLLNAGTSMGLFASASFRERFRTASEGDFFRVIDNGLKPLGMAAFPVVPLAMCAALVAVYFMSRRSATLARHETPRASAESL